MPYHMHINLDLIEACHLISAMLLEVPNMAAQEFDVRRRPLSKNFRNALDRYERQVFTGPPEGTKDFILAAAKYLEDGEWKKSAEFIVGLKVWKLWEGVPNRSDKVKSVILDKLKEAAVRTYMFTFCSYYSSISLQKLSEMFELPTNRIHRIISKMMISKELKASWDQTTGSILVHREDPTRLQKYAMVFAERLSHFVESNERLMDVKCGVLNEDSGRVGVRREEHYSAPRSFGRKTTRRYGGEGGGGGGRNYYRQ
jgi:translation initiation factor 3 subunit C